MNPPDRQDARLTAHALGELPPAQAEAAEAAVWADPAARETVEGLRAVAELLTFSFAAEPQPTLTPAQQRAVLAHPTALTGTREKEARLTAFALGELRPSQHAAVAALLPDDRGARHLTDEVQILAAGLRTAFVSEPELTLTLKQRHHLRARAAAATKEQVAQAPGAFPRPEPAFARAENGRHRVWLHGAAAAAAALALIGFAARREAPTASPPVAVTNGEGFSVQGPERAADPRPPRPELHAVLLALLAKEEERPSLSALVSGPQPETAPADDPAPALVAATTPAVVYESTPFSPRPRPDESLLPPAAAAVVAEPVAQKVSSRARLMAFRSSRPAETAAGPAFIDTRETWNAHLPGTLGRAGYDVARQCVRDFGVLPPVPVVRPEEIVNHFDYDVRPAPGRDFGVAIEAATCPWNERHQLVRVTVAAREAAAIALPPLRLTYFVRLADTQENERLQLLLWQGMQSLLPRLRPQDSLALAVWGRSHGIVLEPRGGWEHAEVRAAIEQLHRGGTPAGPSEWGAAVALARQQFQAGALNRVIVVTDGPLDFDGASSLAKNEAALHAEAISLTVAQLGPLRSDASLPARSFQADSSAEAARLFARDTLQPDTPLAQNVEIRLEFNAAAVRSWRPLGFNGPMAALASSSTGTTWCSGRQVTALYEIVPLEAPVAWGERESDRFARQPGASTTAKPIAPSTAALSVRVRYEVPGQSFKHELTTEWTSSTSHWRAASPDFRLAAGAAGYSLALKADQGVEKLGFATLREIVDSALASRDEFGLRREFATLVADTERLLGR